jgi:hypothetical protein
MFTNPRTKNPKSHQIQCFDRQIFERTTHKFSDGDRFYSQAKVFADGILLAHISDACSTGCPAFAERRPNSRQ